MGPDRVVHERRVFRLVEGFVQADLASPEFLTVVRGVVKDYSTDVPIVVGAALRIAVIQQVKLGSKPTARYGPCSSRVDHATRARMAACIAVKEFNEVDVTA